MSRAYVHVAFWHVFLFYVDSIGFVSPKFIISRLLHGFLVDSSPVQYFQVHKGETCDVMAVGVEVMAHLAT